MNSSEHELSNIDGQSSFSTESLTADEEALLTIPTYSVVQIIAYLRELIETNQLLRDLWVTGEVTNFSRSQAGHIYFSLTEKDTAINCVFFRRDNLGVEIAQGDQVLAHGRVSIYKERGELQMYVNAVQPEGIGVLHAEFKRLLNQLENEGLFSKIRKRPIPKFPKVLGVATSASGAVWHDIQSIAHRRWPMAKLILAPCQVQGEGAVGSIIGAIDALNSLSHKGENEVPELILLARGGGSIEDLWAFNSEQLARVLFASGLPVVSAIGHESDYTISDHVADLRAPTPSAAVELILPNHIDQRMHIHNQTTTLGHALERNRQALQLKLDKLTDRMEMKRPDLESIRIQIDDLIIRAAASARFRISSELSSLASVEGRLSVLNPLATLARGYAIVQNANGQVISDATSTKVGQELRVLMERGVLKVSVKSIDNE